MLDGSVWFSSSSTTPWGSGPGVTSRAPPARLAGGGRRSHQPVDDETRPATRRGRRGGAQQKAPRGTPAMTACSVRVPGRRTAIGAAHHGRGPGNSSRNPPRALSSQKSLAGMRRHHPRAARGGLSPPPGGRHTRFGADAGFAAPADTVPPPPTDHSAAAMMTPPATAAAAASARPAWDTACGSSSRTLIAAMMPATPASSAPMPAVDGDTKWTATRRTRTPAGSAKPDAKERATAVRAERVAKKTGSATARLWEGGAKGEGRRQTVGQPGRCS